MLEYH